jgi:hypothetical protein
LVGGGTLENFLDYFGLASDKEISVAEMFRLSWDVGGKGWRWLKSLFLREEGLMEECYFLLTNIVLQVNELDKWR